MTEKHRVLVIEDDTAFSNGVKHLLGLRADLEIVGTVPVSAPALAAEIDTCTPDVIIVSEEFAAGSANLILNLLKLNPTLRVFTLSLTGSSVSVYKNRQIAVSTIDDLVAAINER